MTNRARIAWCMGAVAAAVVGAACVLQTTVAADAGLSPSGRLGEISHRSGSVVMVGAAAVLLVVAGVGVVLWRSAASESGAPSEAERARRERELMLNSINSSLEGTCIYRLVHFPDGRMECTYVSPNIEHLIGVRAEQFIANAASAFALIHPEDLPAFQGEIARGMATGSPTGIAVRVRHPRGGELWMQFRSHLTSREPDGSQVRTGVVVDLTSVKAAETEIRAVRERLELALRSSRTCIWENYIAANRIMLDGTWAEIRGFPAEPTVTNARELLKIAHPDDRRMVMEFTRRVYAGESDDYRLEQRVATASGGWVWILSVGRVTSRDAKGRAVRMFGTNTDITARHLAEERVRELNVNLEHRVADRTAELVAATEKLTASERHYRNLVENISQGYYVADRRSRLTYANPTISAVTGLSAEELRGMSVFRIVAKEDRRRVMDAYARWLHESVREATMEFRVPLPCGRVIWVEQATTFVRDERGVLLEARNILRDITERKAAEEKLRQSNERFRAVFERSPIIIGLLSAPEGRLIEVNAAGLANFGYTREECLGRTTVELGLWADLADRENYMRELQAKGQVTSAEARMRRKNGEIFFVAYSCSLIQIDGQTYSLNSLIDITAQRESEARLSQALEATSDGLWDWNIATGAVYFSPQWARLLGYEPNEVPARVEFFYSILHPDDVAEVGRSITEHLSGRIPLKQNEVRLRTKDGTYRWFLDRGKVVARDESGAPARMVGTIADITDRKQVEQERLQTLASLRATLESTADGILTIGADRRIESLNRVFARMWRIPPEVLADRDDAKAINFVLEQLSDPDVFLSKVSYLYDHPMEESFDTLEFKDGRHFERYSLPMLADGKPIGRVWSFRDVSARRQAELEREQMQARLRMSQKLEAMGTLAGGIAHDFNNILTGVINYSMLAREECPPTHPRLLKYLGDVLTCGNRAKNLVRQILLFSRAEETEQEPVELPQVLAETIALLRSTLPATVTIETDIDSDVPRMLGNPTQLHQVVMNLGINAAQALRDQTGQILVRLRSIDLDAAAIRTLPDLKPGLHLRLEVVDTGCGMTEAVVSRIFDPFFTTKRAGEGTGLGLAVVHGIMLGHRGAVAVRSRPDAGTTFELFFPVQHMNLPPSQPSFEQFSRGNGERILLVEDEQIVIETMKILLERIGYHVRDFLHANDALACFEAAPDDFDVVITDYMMPDMTGIQLAEKIVSRRPAMPVLLSSGFFANHTADEIKRLNIRGFVQKPIELDKLAESLARAFSR